MGRTNKEQRLAKLFNLDSFLEVVKEWKRLKIENASLRRALEKRKTELRELRKRIRGCGVKGLTTGGWQRGEKT